jgi:hypothetical protein
MPTTRSDAAPFAPVPVVALDRPDDWEPLVLPDALVAVAETVQPGPFRANVVVTRRRVAAEQGTELLESAIADVTSDLEGAERWAELGSEYRAVLGLDGYRVEGAFVMPGTGTVFQAVHLTVVGHGPVADVIGITATCGADEGERLVPTLRAVLDSARLA